MRICSRAVAQFSICHGSVLLEPCSSGFVPEVACRNKKRLREEDRSPYEIIAQVNYSSSGPAVFDGRARCTGVSIQNVHLVDKADA
jgi:hypothetical protein